MAAGMVIVRGSVRLLVLEVKGRKALISWTEGYENKKRWVFFK